MDLIRLNNITKTYDLGEMKVPVLKGVSLTVARGELVALMGASGSGKSTLMNILGCLDHATTGEYWLDGHDISTLNTDQRAHVRNNKIGFVFQSFNLLARTTALENVIMPLTYSDKTISDREQKRRGREILDRVGLGDRMGHFPSQLSGGQQQRVAIARSLINNPPLLFADEPTGNLDSKTSEEVLQMFRTLNDDGITIIIVTHSPEVGTWAKRAITMKDGLIESGASSPPPPAGGGGGRGHRAQASVNALTSAEYGRTTLPSPLPQGERGPEMGVAS